jgi:hypothetical protein
MPKHRDHRRVESPRAAVHRLRRTLMTCFQSDPEYRTWVAGFLATEYHKLDQVRDQGARATVHADYDDFLARAVQRRLRLVDLATGEAPSWAIAAVRRDVVARVTCDRARLRHRRNTRIFMVEESVIGPGYDSMLWFTIKVSPQSLGFDSSWMTAEYEEPIDIFAEGFSLQSIDGKSYSDEIEALRKRAYESVDVGIARIQADLEAQFESVKRTRPTKVKRQDRAAAGLATYLLHGTPIPEVPISETSDGEPPTPARADVMALARTIGIAFP